jgi:hypothetical protein
MLQHGGTRDDGIFIAAAPHLIAEITLALAFPNGGIVALKLAPGLTGTVI